MTLETGTDHLLARQEGRVAVVTFNRPEARNALSSEMYEGFQNILPAIAADPGIGCMLLTGEGGAFCAGGDTKSMAQGDAIPRLDDRVRRVHREHEFPAAIHEMSVPVLAALPGAAAGAGFSIALACDGAPFWFDDWRIEGTRVGKYKKRTIGSLIGVQHTLSRGVMKIPADNLGEHKHLDSRVSGGGSAGAAYETIKDLQGVLQLDKLDSKFALVLIRAADGELTLKAVPLP